MIRTQVQLTNEQMLALKELAQAEQISVAELVRQAIDHWITTVRPVSWAERRQRALAVVGKFRSGCTDVAERHDDYLVEIYSE